MTWDRMTKLADAWLQPPRIRLGRRCAKPPSGKIPPGFTRGTQVPIHLGQLAPRVAHGRDVFQPGFFTRSVAIVPIAIEQPAVGEPHYALAGLADRPPLLAAHPPGVLLAQLQ